MKPYQVLSLGVFVFACSDEKKDSEKLDPFQEHHKVKIPYECPYDDYVELQLNSEDDIESACFANGDRYEVGESPKPIDNCNPWTCTYFEDDDRIGFLTRGVFCINPPIVNVCVTDDRWYLSECFKFTRGGKNCECTQNGIDCELRTYLQ